MKVLKFGGTSVGSAVRMRGVADIVVNDEPKIVVLSAMSGTTNSLVAIGHKLYADDKDGAKQLISELEAKYYDTVKELYKANEFFDTFATFLFLNFLKKSKVSESSSDRTLLPLLPP